MFFWGFFIHRIEKFSYLKEFVILGAISVSPIYTKYSILCIPWSKIIDILEL